MKKGPRELQTRSKIVPPLRAAPWSTMTNAALANAALVLSSKNWKNTHDGGHRRKKNQTILGPVFSLCRRAGIDAALVRAHSLFAGTQIKLNHKFKTLRWCLLRWRLTLSEKGLFLAKLRKNSEKGLPEPPCKEVENKSKTSQKTRLFGPPPPPPPQYGWHFPKKIPERHRKRSQSVSWNSPREYGWDRPSPITQGIWGFQSISRILSPPVRLGTPLFSEVAPERASQSRSWNSQQYWGYFWLLWPRAREAPGTPFQTFFGVSQEEALSGSHRSTRIASDLASRALASQAKPQRESESQAFRIARS